MAAAAGIVQQGAWWVHHFFLFEMDKLQGGSAMAAAPGCALGTALRGCCCQGPCSCTDLHSASLRSALCTQLLLAPPISHHAHVTAGQVLRHARDHTGPRILRLAHSACLDAAVLCTRGGAPCVERVGGSMASLTPSEPQANDKATAPAPHHSMQACVSAC